LRAPFFYIMKWKLLLCGLFSFGLLVGLTGNVFAFSYSQSFDTMATGTIDSQQGWGAYTYDGTADNLVTADDYWATSFPYSARIRRLSGSGFAPQFWYATTSLSVVPVYLSYKFKYSGTGNSFETGFKDADVFSSPPTDGRICGISIINGFFSWWGGSIASVDTDWHTVVIKIFGAGNRFCSVSFDGDWQSGSYDTGFDMLGRVYQGFFAWQYDMGGVGSVYIDDVSLTDSTPVTPVLSVTAPGNLTYTQPPVPFAGSVTGATYLQISYGASSTSQTEVIYAENFSASSSQSWNFGYAIPAGSWVVKVLAWNVYYDTLDTEFFNITSPGGNCIGSFCLTSSPYYASTTPRDFLDLYGLDISATSSTPLVIGDLGSYCDTFYATSTSWFSLTDLASDIAYGGCSLLMGIFVPSEASVERLTNIPNLLENKFPFSYVYDFSSMISSLTASTSVPVISLVVPTGHNSTSSVPIISASVISQYPFVSYIRNGIGYSVYLVFAFWLVRGVFKLF